MDLAALKTPHMVSRAHRVRKLLAHRARKWMGGLGLAAARKAPASLTVAPA